MIKRDLGLEYSFSRCCQERFIKWSFSGEMCVREHNKL